MSSPFHGKSDPQFKVLPSGRNFKFIKCFEPDEPVVSMVIFNDKLYLATSKRVFVKDEKDNFIQLEFVVQE